MSDDPEASPTIVKDGFRRFAVGFPIALILYFAGARFSVDSNAGYFAWLRDHWVSELIKSLVMATVLSFGMAFEDWRNYWENNGKREDGYRPKRWLEEND